MPNLPDFANYDDEKLDAARTAILAEKERRQRLASVPSEVASMARRYAEDGGDPSDLVAAVQGAEETPDEGEPLDDPQEPQE